MARVYQPDHDGLNAIARSPEMRAALEAAARRAQTIAEGLSTDFTDTGDYLAHFEVEADTIDWAGEYPGRRAAAYLVNDSGHAAAVEWGSARNHKPHHVLSRTLGMLDHG